MAEFSPRTTARWAGLLYLINALCGLWAEVFVRGKIIVTDNAAVTAANILDHPLLYRSGFVADLVSMVTEIIIAVLFYYLFRHVNRGVAATMVLFRLVWAAVFAAIALSHIAPLLLLNQPGIDRGQAQAFSYFFPIIYLLPQLLYVVVASLPGPRLVSREVLRHALVLDPSERGGCYAAAREGECHEPRQNRSQELLRDQKLPVRI